MLFLIHIVHAQSTEEEEFAKEIEITKSIGNHSNIVNMLACVTQQKPLCAIVEYMNQGDLVHYLRKMRDEVFVGMSHKVH